MKKTLRLFSLVLGILAAGTFSTLADESDGKKPGRGSGERGGAERDGKRGDGERGGRRGGARQIPKEILEKYDKNKDGKLDEDERKAFMEARRAEMIKKYDKDGDGELSDDERKAAMEDRRKQGRGRPGGGEGGRPGRPGGKGGKGDGKKPQA
ncbi:MAG: EF-hand domain-containing protein [Roseibacillus sp.]|jgi:hypothetical protein